MVTGTIGTPACSAILNGPRLKAISRPVTERPPSGKVITELPSASDCSRSVARAAERVSTRRSLATGEWETSRPRGCFQSGSDRRVHFNWGEGGGAEEGDQALCELVADAAYYAAAAAGGAGAGAAAWAAALAAH